MRGFPSEGQCKAEARGRGPGVTHFADVLTVEQFTQVGRIFLAHVVY